MAVSIAGLRRNIKNVAHNYTDAQVKVREATSNDPWGPSSTQMSEIADLTYNMVAFSEIMQMIWKRLNDHGKNWRHVYKALVLLEYLIKTGSEKVAQQCKENIFAIQTLKDFQFVEDNKDQGLNVREKAKALVALLKDDERLKNERTRALKAKERFAQSTQGYHPDHQGSPMGSPGDDFQQSRLKPDIELARPQTQGEEELQLQLALAMSREEADAEDSKKKSDDMRLQMAIAKSKEGGDDDKKEAKPKKSGGSALNDLVDLNFGGPAASVVSPNPPQRTAASLDPWSPVGGAMGATGGGGQDPWGGMGPIISSSTIPDPWGGIGGVGVPPSRGSPLVFAGGSSSPPSAGVKPGGDPWGSGGAPAPSGGNNGNNDPWGAPANTEASPAKADPFYPALPTSDPSDVMAAFGGGAPSNNGHGVSSAQASPWDLGGLDPVPLMGQSQGAVNKNGKSAVENLLGEHSNLVNLDSLIQPKRGQASGQPQAGGAKNPFSEQPNPFQAAAAPKPSMNELRGGNQQPPAPQLGGWPNQNNSDINPFF